MDEMFETYLEEKEAVIQEQKDEIASLKTMVISLKEENSWLLRELITTPPGEGDDHYLT